MNTVVMQRGGFNTLETALGKPLAVSLALSFVG
jgi:hypothetical protein